MLKRRHKMIIVVSILILIAAVVCLTASIVLHRLNNEVDSTGLPRKIRKSEWYDEASGRFRFPVDADCEEWSGLADYEKIEVQSIPEDILPWIPADNLVELYWNLSYYTEYRFDDNMFAHQEEARRIFAGRTDVAQYLIELYRNEPIVNDEYSDRSIRRIEALLERQVIQQAMTAELKEEYRQVLEQKAQEKRDHSYYNRHTYLGDDLLIHYD
ncbi:hypothetical protein [Anaerolentibacter hominis]|uniref:hypothetical protein n=1 Tax=Anaerolentibacter hominis TaxID=3079009 RepID=UPI0031B84DBE